jgi:hypothetical protein
MVSGSEGALLAKKPATTAELSTLTPATPELLAPL